MQWICVIFFNNVGPQVYINLSQKNLSAVFERLNRCQDELKDWISGIKLKPNPDKTVFIVLGSKRERDKLKAHFPATSLGSPLCLAESVNNLGLWLDCDFSLSKHVQNFCKSCFVHLCHFRHVMRYLSHDASVLVANALVSSWLVYCNSLFRSLSKFNLHKLQCIQNSAARIISNISRYTSRYISSYTSFYSTWHSQIADNFLFIPKLKLSFHKSVKQFGYCLAFDAHTVWNALPDENCASPSLVSFRKCCKSYLYTKAYPH